MSVQNRIIKSILFALILTLNCTVFAQLIVEVDNKLYFYRNNTENATAAEDYAFVEEK
jgi:hypothetical protein